MNTLTIWLSKTFLGKRYVQIMGDSGSYRREVLIGLDGKAYVCPEKSKSPDEILVLDNPLQKKGEFRNGKKLGFHTWFYI